MGDKPEGPKGAEPCRASSYIRKSTLSAPELVAMYPYLPVIAESFEEGNGEYRPRIPQYPETLLSGSGVVGGRVRTEALGG
jgi:multiple sugar transport system substrate-binding protein